MEVQASLPLASEDPYRNVQDVWFHDKTHNTFPNNTQQLYVIESH
jgi:hypothetical protein